MSYTHLFEYVWNKIETVKTEVTNLTATKKTYIIIHCEESSSLSANNIEFSFGNSLDNDLKYGFPLPCDGKIKSYSICSAASDTYSGEIRLNMIINGVETTDSNYQLVKPTGVFSNVTSFQPPYNVNKNNRIYVRKKTTNGSVTHTIIVFLIKINV